MNKSEAMIRLEVIAKEIYPIAKEFKTLTESFTNINFPTHKEIDRVNDLADEIEQLVMQAQAIMDCVQINNLNKNITNIIDNVNKNPSDSVE